ncbi:activating signal cointegrator 1 complex subunit 1 [Plakobranchus ocellatus]|uniref:Activating signal cointegrator 1 complex subunit 1 n=1 Tax=Plakobranchus ocellatus TaxID=259542 RepID=A0AAV4CEH1_9GAST|nr:activating signal cointegrator 1 complex subunit 1 [Plakobranchus ocellatus]
MTITVYRKEHLQDTNLTNCGCLDLPSHQQPNKRGELVCGMEVLRPQLVWIGNRCYRKNALKESSSFNPEDEEIYNADQASDWTYGDEVCDAGLDIAETSKGFCLRLPVPSVFNKYIIGKRGETKKRLETETRTQIFVPKPGDKDEVIVIKGQDRKGVVSAKTRIDVLVDSARRNQPFTHFLSIPVTSDDIVTSFENFKDDILFQCEGDEGVDASIFQTPQKLHLTIGTLVLLSKGEIDKAVSVLQSCQGDFSSVTEEQPLSVQIEGLEYMNDDPSAVDVLYAKVKEGKAADR